MQFLFDDDERRDWRRLCRGVCNDLARNVLACDQVFVTTLEFKLVTLASIILVPFAVWQKTTFLSDRALGYVFSVGAKVADIGPGRDNWREVSHHSHRQSDARSGKCGSHCVGSLHRPDIGLVRRLSCQCVSQRRTPAGRWSGCRCGSGHRGHGRRRLSGRTGRVGASQRYSAAMRRAYARRQSGSNGDRSPSAWVQASGAQPFQVGSGAAPPAGRPCAERVRRRPLWGDARPRRRRRPRLPAVQVGQQWRKLRPHRNAQRGRR